MLELNWNLLYTAFNLVIWYIIIKMFLLKPIQKVIDQRNDLINSRLNDAENTKRDAYALKAKYEDNIKGALDEKDRILDEARDSAKVEYDRILDEAKVKADAMLTTAKQKAKEEHKRIIRESDAEMAKLVLEATRKVMMTNRSEETDKHIYDEFLLKEGEENNE